MAKKTSYLTELIERHERWKAEGGERAEDDEQDLVSDLYVLTHTCDSLRLSWSTRPANGDPEDLWDFGTVRHSSRPATVGRSQNHVQVSGPPLTWENNGTTRSDDSAGSTHRGFGSSGSSKYASSISTKGDLPPLPPSVPAAPATPKGFDQSTVRHMPPETVNETTSSSNQRTVQREPSDEYEDYDDQYLDTFPGRAEVVQLKMEQVQLDDEDVPDTTMLDSVILPAIASVSLCDIITETGAQE